jgi:hypothetical protein
MSLLFLYIGSVAINLLAIGLMLLLPARGVSLLKEPPNSIRECLDVVLASVFSVIPVLPLLCVLSLYWKDLYISHRLSAWLDKPFKEEK